jgi:hypothetical protein
VGSSLPTGLNFLGSSPNQSDHALLTYQAVQVGDMTSTSKADLFSTAPQDQNLKHTRPNLGIWTCRLEVPTSLAGASEGAKPSSSDQENVADLLLQNVVFQKKASSDDAKILPLPPTFLWTVSLDQVAQVTSDLQAMQSAVVRQLSLQGKNASGTTNLSQLMQTTFGAAPDSLIEGPGNIPESAESVTCHLVLVAVLPRETESATYVDKQALALTLYHLHKYVASVNATLVFSSTSPSKTAQQINQQAPTNTPAKSAPEGEETTGMRQESIDVRELANLLQKMAMGQEDDTKEKEEEEEEVEDAKESSAAVYPSGKHDLELIETVLLRNASCKGEWDATTDDLWNISWFQKKHIAESPKKKKNTSEATVGDAEWLGQLATSVGGAVENSGPLPGTTTPNKRNPTPSKARAPSTQKKRPASSVKKAPPAANQNEAANFFADLLSK